MTRRHAPGGYRHAGLAPFPLSPLHRDAVEHVNATWHEVLDDAELSGDDWPHHALLGMTVEEFNAWLEDPRRVPGRFWGALA